MLKALGNETPPMALCSQSALLMDGWVSSPPSADVWITEYVVSVGSMLSCELPECDLSEVTPTINVMNVVIAMVKTKMIVTLFFMNHSPPNRKI
ncbi:hypothetical protein D3C75_1151370 [compost metagenome]